ncbi:MAG: hypothetical protein VB064_05915 [Oscillospiraceae bacterium]|nr:hypothetical protein [Oscillospiraceae bacterium]
MDTSISTIVAASAGIIAAVIGTVSSSRKHDQNLAVHSKISEKDHSEIKKDIASGTNHVIGAINISGKEVTEVRSVLSGLKDRIIENESLQKVHFTNLDDAQKKLCSSAEDIGKFAAEFSKLVNENKQLREENKNLTIKNDNLKYRLEKDREIIKRLQPEAEQDDEELAMEEST